MCKTSREKMMEIFEHKNTNHECIWVGHPNNETVDIYAKEWNIAPTREAIFDYLNDDCRWVLADSGYHHPSGRAAIDPAYKKERHSLSAAGFFEDAEEISDLDAYPWPDVADCDFTDIYAEIDKYPDKMVFTGLWSPFFHNATDFLGMENYFINLHENPELIEALTERIVDYYVAANEKFFAGLGDRADVMFFGNDLGTQLDLFLSPEHFRRFILPGIKRLIAVGKKYNKKVMMHSCGSIYRIIPDLINAGVDILHPIQAQAKGMSAAELAQYKNDLVFVGGIDAQDLFVNGSPEDIKEEVKRVRSILGSSIVISPSHEEILPNVPAANIRAMAEEGKHQIL